MVFCYYHQIKDYSGKSYSISEEYSVSIIKNIFNYGKSSQIFLLSSMQAGCILKSETMIRIFDEEDF
jgi:hypothetical protein